MRTAALVSGGIDSCVMLAELAPAADELLPVYVRTGLVWEDAELHWLTRFLNTVELPHMSELALLELPVRDLYGEHWSTTGSGTPGVSAPLESNYLPGRNLLLLAKASVYCALRGIGRIALAPLADNPFADGTPAFLAAFAALSRDALGCELAIELPFRTLEKGEVVRRGRHLPLELTFSCIRPVGFDHCGECTKCAERRRGFARAGVKDPTRYRGGTRG